MKRIFLIVTGFFFVVLLWQKLELGLLRYFDADEFAYLHWAHNVYAGRLPYRDFLLYVPPGFLYVLAPLFFFFKGTGVLIAGRVLAWVIFLGICVALGVMLVLLRGNRGDKGDWGLFFLPGIVLSFLPIPSDKFLEIRPDNPATLISLIGLLCQIRKKPFWAGMCYGAALLILPKTLPIVAVAFIVMPSILFGLLVPLVPFGLWVLSMGDGAIYSLLKLPFEVNRIAERFPMQPGLFFYPNATYYGQSGWSIGLLANHAVWLLGLFAGIHSLMSGEFLIAGALFSYVAAFMYGYPLRHAQYLIPIAAFVALYAADAIRKIGGIGVIGVIGGMMYISSTVTIPKLAWTNREDLATLARIMWTVPKDAYVFDLTGATIFYRDPYYVSAVPFYEWQPYLSRPLPPLQLAPDVYIYRDRLGRADRVVSK